MQKITNRSSFRFGVRRYYRRMSQVKISKTPVRFPHISVALIGLLLFAPSVSTGGTIVADRETTQLIQQLTSSGLPIPDPFTDSSGAVEDHADLLGDRTRSSLSRELSKFYAEKGVRLYLRTSAADVLPSFHKTALRLVENGKEPTVVAVFTQNPEIYLHAFNDAAVARLGEERLASLVSGMLNENQTSSAPEAHIIGCVVSLVRGIVHLSEAHKSDLSESQPLKPAESAEVNSAKENPLPTSNPPSEPSPTANEPDFPQMSQTLSDENFLEENKVSPLKPTGELPKIDSPPKGLLLVGLVTFVLLALMFLLSRMRFRQRPSPLRIRRDLGVEPSMPVYNKIPRSRKQQNPPLNPATPSNFREREAQHTTPSIVSPAFEEINEQSSEQLGPEQSLESDAEAAISTSETTTEIAEISQNTELTQSLLLLENYAAEMRRAPADRRASMIRGLEIIMLAVREKVERGNKNKGET